MEKFNQKKIEKKLLERWAKESLHQADDKSDKKLYILDMFPYPSGAGLHVGHVESYTATDIYSRYLRMNGYNVLHPQGWDAFGLPAENYAIQTGVHPSITTSDAVATFKKQMDSMGFSYDWSREVNSSDPEYYKWTQWFFLFLYKNDLAYKAKAKVNWCESCQTVLANEQAEGGKCERCKNDVIQKDLEQWYFRITNFIEDQKHKGRKIKGLLSGLEDIDWPESTKQGQRNWIGRSEGAEVIFSINDEKVTVFTTRPDTLFGATYFVLSPEHPLIINHKSKIKNQKEVEEYIKKAKKKTEKERTDLAKEKTGVELKGLKAINPVNNEKIPVWIADYVMMEYGTGAIMAVPAHDERDMEFAHKFKLPIIQVVTPDLKGYDKSLKALAALKQIADAAKKQEIKFWVLGGIACAIHAGIIYREHDDLDLIVKEVKQHKQFLKILEELGYILIKEKKLTATLTSIVYENADGLCIDIGQNQHEFGMSNKDFEDGEKELNGVKARVISKRYLINFKEAMLKKRDEAKDKIDIDYLQGKVFIEDGYSINSDIINSLNTKEAKKKITVWLEKKGKGEASINYKMRDWLVSRQRYWGAPIPIIYCDDCGEVPVLEKDLPVLLPDDVDFKPTGESPLNYSKTFHDVKCPECNEPAKRESDTMDTFVCSSWYYLRYADPKNEKEFASAKLLKQWLPVDVYVGGAEHVVLHLLYSRFFTKALQKHGKVDFNEPFLKLRHQGIILGEDSTKMSKSKGNVINPDDVIKEFGADALRMYEMFMGPLEDMKPWSTRGIIGVKRFLDKVWRLNKKVRSKELSSVAKAMADKEVSSEKLENLLHKTIKKVGEDIVVFKFNTAIAQMMILANEFDKESTITDKNFKLFLLILSPFAPHLTEELWEKLGNKDSIFKEKWPVYDKELIKDETITLVVQVNGKVRDNIVVEADIKEEAAKEVALTSEKAKKWIVDKEIVKVIYVKGKLVNIVIK